MNEKNIAGVIAVTSLLTACGGGGSESSNNSSGSSSGSSPGSGDTGAVTAFSSLKPNTQAEAARFLLQTQFNTNLTEINSLLNSTYKDYLTAQFNSPISITGWEWLNSKGYNAINSNIYFEHNYPTDYMIWQQLISSEDNLRKKISLTLSEFFVVSLLGLNTKWVSHASASWWDLLNSNCFTTYRALLGAITLHPSMGNYLNIAGSAKENAAGRAPDENYAREVMQLFSLGIYKLNIDGTEISDGNGNKTETYTQKDITNLARAFTGWNYDSSQNVFTPILIFGKTVNVPNTTSVKLPLIFNSNEHSTLPATFLGANMPSDGIAALNSALDTIANHANVAPFFCKQMIKKLITSNPSPAYVQRVATIFNDNGSGVRGDLKSVFMAIFIDSEARDLTNISLATFGKVKEPMHRFIQWSRTFKCTSKFGSWKIGDMTNNLGQSPLRSPNVFNFFRPNYIPPSTQLATLALTAPEFQIINESTVSSYINFMQSIIKTGIYTTAPEIANATSTINDGYDITPDYSEALKYVTNSNSLVDYLDLILNYSQTSNNNKKLIISALDSFGVTETSNSAATTKLNKLSSAILLIMSSTDYIIQK